MQVDVHLPNKDLRIDTYRLGGSGGQHANTTNSVVWITHIASGLTIVDLHICKQAQENRMVMLEHDIYVI